MINLKLKKPFIFEIKLEDLLFFYSRCDQFLYLLIAKPGLARSPHTDNDIRLPFHFRKLPVSRCRIRQFSFMKVINKLRNYFFHSENIISILEIIQSVLISLF